MERRDQPWECIPFSSSESEWIVSDSVWNGNSLIRMCGVLSLSMDEYLFLSLGTFLLLLFQGDIPTSHNEECNMEEGPDGTHLYPSKKSFVLKILITEVAAAGTMMIGV